MSGPSDFKEQGRIVVHGSDWQPIRAEKAGPCRSCGSNGEVELHHLVPRSLRGSDVLENLIPLCHSCHMEWEDRGPRWTIISAGIRESLTPAEIHYVVETKGEDFLTRYYPDGAQMCPTCGRKKRAPNRAEPKEKGPRKRWVLTLPADEPAAADALDELIAQAKERLVQADAVASDVGPFVVLCAVLYEWNTT